VVERVSQLVRMAGLFEEMRVDGQCDRRIRVAKLGGDTRGVELESDDQQGGERVAEGVRAGPLVCQSGTLDRAPDPLTCGAVVTPSTVRGRKDEVGRALKREAIRCSRRIFPSCGTRTTSRFDSGVFGATL
jgi:hypothetical protein